MPLVTFEEAPTDSHLSTARAPADPGPANAADELVEVVVELRLQLGLDLWPQADLPNARQRLFDAVLAFVRDGRTRAGARCAWRTYTRRISASLQAVCSTWCARRASRRWL